jgi:Zn-dependent M28 family amino/carboxypeptidase
MSRSTRVAALLAAVTLLAACASTPAPTVGPTSLAPTASAPTNLPAGQITEAGLRDHLDALAALSTKADGFRAVGSTGYDAAADLVISDLRAAGWQVQEDAFTTPAFFDDGGSSLKVDGQIYEAGDIAPLIFAPGGEVTGPVVAIDFDTTQSTGKGCSAAGYDDLPEGAIVLVPSGGCYRREQILAAQTAGAAGFVAGYPSADAGKVLRPTLLEPDGLTIPSAGATGPVVDALIDLAAKGGDATLVTRARTVPSSTRSIIAELPGSEPGSVIMLGAHLDSVIDGPGVNDNGSGVAALLEIARSLAGTNPRATIRLAFWAAEEVGLRGSFHYVDGLSTEEREAIRAYLNVDMVASPNGFAGVYNETGAAPGSETLRDLLAAAIERTGGSPVTLELGGGSDHFAFEQVGIPIGGVFSGANEAVSGQQAAASGSQAGAPADPCYHTACDDGSDLDLALAKMLTSVLAEVSRDLAHDPMLLER